MCDSTSTFCYFLEETSEQTYDILLAYVSVTGLAFNREVKFQLPVRYTCNLFSISHTVAFVVALFIS